MCCGGAKNEDIDEAATNEGARKLAEDMPMRLHHPLFVRVARIARAAIIACIVPIRAITGRELANRKICIWRRRKANGGLSRSHAHLVCHAFWCL